MKQNLNYEELLKKAEAYEKLVKSLKQCDLETREKVLSELNDESDSVKL